MTFHVWPIIREGGPWAAFFLLLGLMMWMRLSGRWLPEREVDRAIKGYVDTNDHLKSELAWTRQASADKDKTIQTLSEQNSKLMIHSAVSAHALKAITGPLDDDGAPEKEATS